jgi:hypothetical protein
MQTQLSIDSDRGDQVRVIHEKDQKPWLIWFGLTAGPGAGRAPAYQNSEAVFALQRLAGGPSQWQSSKGRVAAGSPATESAGPARDSVSTGESESAARGPAAAPATVLRE